MPISTTDTEWENAEDEEGSVSRIKEFLQENSQEAHTTKEVVSIFVDSNEAEPSVEGIESALHELQAKGYLEMLVADGFADKRTIDEDDYYTITRRGRLLHHHR